MVAGSQTQYSPILEVYNFHFVFSDPVKPIRILWIVGDGFFRSAYSELQSMKTGNDPKVWPYIYQQFQLKPYFQKSAGTSDGATYKLHNSLAEALNAENRLPEYVLIFPDRDIILDINYFKPGNHTLIKLSLNWLAKEIDKSLAGRSRQATKTGTRIGLR